MGIYLNTDERGFVWNQTTAVTSLAYVCGYCHEKVASAVGYRASKETKAHQYIRICPHCGGPTYFVTNGRRYPGNMIGAAVANVPDDLNALYVEARSSAAAGAYTAAVLCCRKMLMNIAVHQQAGQNLSFAGYVEYLASNGYVPPNGKTWVDYIRKRGNEATHEIALMTEQDATSLIRFVEMLLKFVFELPSMIPVDESQLPPRNIGGAGATR